MITRRGYALGVLAVVVAIAVAPVVVLTLHALFERMPDGTLQPSLVHLRTVLSRVRLGELFGNSLVFAAGSAALALVAGTLLAWVAERSDVPGRSALLMIGLLPLAFPGVLFNLAWILLASPRIGWLNRIASEGLGVPAPLVDIYSMQGMIWVDGLHSAPVAFLMMVAAFRAVDPTLEESARLAGASQFAVLRKVVLPMLLPALGGAFLLLFLHALESIEAPAFLGLPAGIQVFTSAIVDAFRRDGGELGPVSALAALPLIVTVLGVLLLRRVTGEAGRRAMPTPGVGRAPPVALGRWRTPVALLVLAWCGLSLLLPFAALLWSSLHPWGLSGVGAAGSGLGFDEYRRLARYPQVGEAFANSLLLAGLAATIVMVLASVVAWISVRGNTRIERALDPIASLPIAYPGVVVGVAIMILSLSTGGWLYGTIWILLVAYVTRFLPVGVRYSSAALTRVPVELEEAGRISGATPAGALARITVPLALPGLAVGWCYVAIVAFRELSASLLLYSPGSAVIGVVLWDMLEAGQYGTASAIGVLFVLALGCLILFLRRARVYAW